MSDELSTKISLDLDSASLAKSLEDITSDMNEMLKALKTAQDG